MAQTKSSPPGPEVDFDFDAVFEVDDYLYFYSEDLTGERSDAEVAAWVQLLALDPPLRILDLACGFGRHANRLAALGHTVTGVDLTPGFLEIARRDAAARGVQVDYRQGDMRRIDFAGEFDRVLVLFTSFGYFSDDENLRVLENVARALRPGGRLGFDVPNRDVFLRGFTPDQVVEKNGDLMVNRLSFDMRSGRMRNRRFVIRGGVRRDKPFSIRLYNATELGALLERAGLDVIGLYGGWDARPLSPDSRILVAVAGKLG